MVADKAYSSRGSRAYLRRRGIDHTIPEKTDQQQHRRNRGRRGGRSPGFDCEIHGRRNTVERCFNALKNFRDVATRYDKTATSYEAAVTLASFLLWARSLRRALRLGLRGLALTLEVLRLFLRQILLGRLVAQSPALLRRLQVVHIGVYWLVRLPLVRRPLIRHAVCKRGPNMPIRGWTGWEFRRRRHVCQSLSVVATVRLPECSDAVDLPKYLCDLNG